MIVRITEMEDMQEGKVNKVIANIKDKGSQSQEEFKKLATSVIETNIINENMVEKMRKVLQIKIPSMEEQIEI